MIYLFMADGAEEIEAIAVYDVLKRGKRDVVTVGVSGKTVKLSHGLTVVCDFGIDDVQPDETLEAVILPGGMPGTINLENSAAVHKFLDYAQAADKLLCAICAAPSILGHKQLLRGKRAVCFPGFEKDLYGAEIPADTGVVRDGNIITAKGAGVALEFGGVILAALTDADAAADVLSTMQYRA
ncbi:MAG: DJ-1/PfpI family protein [Clostridia bacterium]|nr:DJ-1/PfpI family protein [Clostridia bacterium]